MNSMWNTHWSNKGSKPPSPRPISGTGQAPGSASGTLLRKVLVVDDEPDLADMAATLLSAHGLDVVAAYSAHEAIRVLESDSEIDAVFSDVVMPGMTGLELADAVKSLYPRIKIVLASGYTLPELLTNRERPYLFATKPYRIDTILKLLHS